MPKVNPHAVRIERARELDRMADILSTNFNKNTVIDVGPVHSAASACRIGGGDYWGYTLEKLKFPIIHFSRPVPGKFFKKRVVLELSVKVVGHCYIDGAIRDPFKYLEFNIVIKGTRIKSGSTVPIMCSWHLDRHEFEDREEGEDDDSDEDETPESRFIHPFYHFQHGGHAVWESGYDFGSSFILSSPRFPHPPMDAIAGIDFVLTNFFPSTELEFRNEGEYQNLLREAHYRVWRPYAQAIAHHWSPSPNESLWPKNKLWPQVCERAEAN